MSAEVHHNMEPVTLASHIELFILDNRNSRCLEERWLAAYLTEALEAAREVRNNKLTERFRKLVTEFRLVELKRQRSDKLAEVEKIDSETERLSSPQ